MLTTRFDDSNKKEILQDNQYEQFVKVENDDLVVDLGCSKGYFFYKHLDKFISYIGVDGSIDCINDFYNSLEPNESPVLLNLLIGWYREVKQFQSMYHPDQDSQKVVVIPFRDLLQLIDRRIDFLKFDIESWEICFWENHINYELFKTFIYKFSGEIHFLHEDNNQNRMTNCLLKLIDDPDLNIKLFSLDSVDITEQFWQHPNYYTEIILSGYNKRF